MFGIKLGVALSLAGIALYYALVQLGKIIQPVHIIIAAFFIFCIVLISEIILRKSFQSANNSSFYKGFSIAFMLKFFSVLIVVMAVHYLFHWNTSEILSLMSLYLVGMGVLILDMYFWKKS